MYPIYLNNYYILANNGILEVQLINERLHNLIIILKTSLKTSCVQNSDFPV